MLAIAMWSEYGYDIDLMKVLAMLAVHEIEETKIGDLTPFEIDKKTKNVIGHKAVEEILASLIRGATIKELIFEFDERKTNEAKFAYYCDKLEADLQCKLYDEEHCINIKKHVSNEAKNDEYIKKTLQEEGNLSGLWLKLGQERYGYDNNFKSISSYVKNNRISTKA